MKNQLLFLLTLFVCFNCYSQVLFKPGYYVDRNNKKTTCLIKNTNWRNNPTEFEYKLSENEEPKIGKVALINEFGVNNTSKYVKGIVNIDRSRGTTSDLSETKEPVFNEEELFLKVLVEGKFNLYEYVDGSIRRYFYSEDGDNIEQLIFKNYKTKDNLLAQNNKFRQQLWINLKCPSFTMKDVERLDYTKNDLVRFFNKYSACHNTEPIKFTPKQKKDLFNLTLRPRLNNSSLSVINTSTNGKTTNFDSKLGFGFGLEAEFILPYNNNKWAIVVESTYQNFKSEKTIENNFISGGQQITEVDYSSIEIPISLRHYFHLNNNEKIFVNASYVFDISSKSSIELKRADNSSYSSLDVNSKKNLAIGVGYKLDDKYGIEMRYQTNREILNNYNFWNADYKTFSIIFGYTLF
ncbi:porin family protein [Bizionia paragorgiae]|uniref:Outer membrane protein beta-barrel domain-containing protein n=1 Tax=Bizionia paragorgiae TaxID=283786 RepID=A0A1H3ZEG5_BIZPA|nr:PorT family protein [Bizionia paragorgiae]SEA21801.1 hypothetical protein SAMN04487990_108101 [Bizionia paragorgiae]